MENVAVPSRLRRAIPSLVVGLAWAVAQAGRSGLARWLVAAGLGLTLAALFLLVIAAIVMAALLGTRHQVHQLLTLAAALIASTLVTLLIFLVRRPRDRSS